jgi:hypothetical protein
MNAIPAESIVLVEGIIKPAEVKSCTVQTCEIQIRKIHTIVEVTQRLPFGVDEASRTEADYAKEDTQFARVNLDSLGEWISMNPSELSCSRKSWQTADWTRKMAWLTGVRRCRYGIWLQCVRGVVLQG